MIDLEAKLCSLIETLISKMEDKVGKLVFPGEVLCQIQSNNDEEKRVIGPGLISSEECITVTKPGILRFKEPTFFWIDCLHKRVCFHFSVRLGFYVRLKYD